MMWPFEGKPTEENILMQEGEWYLLALAKIPELEACTIPFGMASTLAHMCPYFAGPEECQLLGIDDSVAGMCWWCKEKIPEDLQQVWMLHNFEAVGRADLEHVNSLKEEAV